MCIQPSVGAGFFLNLISIVRGDYKIYKPLNVVINGNEWGLYNGALTIKHGDIMI